MFGTRSVPCKSNILIHAPVKVVWEFIVVEFYQNYPRWSPEVVDLEPLTPGPLRPGAMAWQVRVDQGHKSESTFKVTEFDECRRICFEGVSNPFRVAYEFEDCKPATRVTFEFELLKLELFMVPFEKLIRFALQDGAERTVRNLKRLIEAAHLARV